MANKNKISEQRQEGDSLSRFSDRATLYAAHRPSYPPEAADLILSGLSRSEETTVADIGAGTGISARFLAASGVTVHAVEPNGPMRDVGEATASAGGRVIWRDGTGEATGLPEASMDVVVCAQAFHWLEPASAIGEFRRILRRPGRIALMWNVHDPASPHNSAYREILLRHATDPPRSPWNSPFNDERVAAITGVSFAVHRFTYEQSLDLDGLIGRARSSSYAPLKGAAGDRLVDDLTAFFADHAADGRLTLTYETSVYVADIDDA